MVNRGYVMNVTTRSKDTLAAVRNMAAVVAAVGAVPDKVFNGRRK